MAYAITKTINDKSNARRSMRNLIAKGHIIARTEHDPALVRNDSGWVVLADINREVDTFSGKALAYAEKERLESITGAEIGVAETIEGLWIVFHHAKPEAGHVQSEAPTPEAAEPEAPTPEAKPQATRKRAAKQVLGEAPIEPDFSADTHKAYRKKLAALVAMHADGNIDGLRAMEINPTSTSPKALIRYRDAAIAHLEATRTREAA